jgi:hypothetical protein
MEIALSDPEVEAETFAALESVFPHHGLRRFFSTGPPEEKSAQLKELASIVLGEASTPVHIRCSGSFESASWPPKPECAIISSTRT